MIPDVGHSLREQHMSELSYSSAFQGKSIFVTGHTGFKGSWLCLWLKQLGARVAGYALDPPTSPNNFDVCRVEESLDRHHIGDIRDHDTLVKAMSDAKPDLVLHLAAQTVVREGYRIPRETFDVNVMGTASVLDCVRELDRPCAVICVTSDKCYENRDHIWGYRESDPMGESDPYGASKGAAELLIRSYRNSFFHPEKLDQHGVKLASVRAGNVIGGGDWTSDALIVDLVNSLIDGRPAELRNPSAYRPWQHVLQALSGYLALAGRMLRSNEPTLCSGWNIGPLPGNELSVSQLVEQFIAEWGHGSWKDVSSPHEPHESRLLYLAVDKAVWGLNWKPAWSVQKAIAMTVDWYKHYVEDPQTIRQFTMSQIDAFEAQMAGGDDRTEPSPVANPAHSSPIDARLSRGTACDANPGALRTETPQTAASNTFPSSE